MITAAIGSIYGKKQKAPVIAGGIDKNKNTGILVLYVLDDSLLSANR